jgi:hypothetical protein
LRTKKQEEEDIMQRRAVRFISRLIVFSIILAFFPYLAYAKQPENPVEFVEGEEPLSINYGQYTIGARIENPTDIDSFSFYGSAGDSIRVIVSKESGLLSPRLEIWDPNGDKIVDTWDYDDVSVDKTLVTTGTYLMAVSDHQLDYPGDYEIEIQCLFGNCPCFPRLSLHIILNQNVFHTGDTLIVSAHVVNGPDPVRVEVKTWIDLPNGDQMSILDPYFTFTVGSNADFTKEIFRHTFGGGGLSGGYNVGGRFLNPISGRELSVDVMPFSFSP